ncbi:MAG: hypothetical protein MUP41_14130, partial [Desulfobacterales bacterium]|nr:hypothetical protein [Desulfobacterales bacterium]
DYAIACYPERVNPERIHIENPDALESYTPGYCQQVRDSLPTDGICDPAFQGCIFSRLVFLPIGPKGEMEITQIFEKRPPVPACRAYR